MRNRGRRFPCQCTCRSRSKFRRNPRSRPERMGDVGVCALVLAAKEEHPAPAEDANYAKESQFRLAMHRISRTVSRPSELERADCGRAEGHSSRLLQLSCARPSSASCEISGPRVQGPRRTTRTPTMTRGAPPVPLRTRTTIVRGLSTTIASVATSDARFCLWCLLACLAGV